MNSDDKRIGRNIKAIRNANNKNYLEFAEMIGISDSALQKIENGSRHPTDEIIMIISKMTNYTFNDIKYGNLDYLNKKNLYFKESVTFLSISENLEVNKMIDSYLEKMFPLLCNNKALKSVKFKTGYEMAYEIKKRDASTSTDLLRTMNDYIQTIDLFLQSINEGVDAIAYVNALSCFANYYFLFINEYLDDTVLNTLARTQISSFIDITNAAFQYQNQGLMMKRKKKFMEKYKPILTKLMRDVANSKEYYDYAYYYLWIRYSIGMLDEDEIKLDEDQMKIYSESLFECLWKMGNKYAVDLHNYIEADK